MTQTTIRCEDYVIEKIKEIAKVENRSIAYIVNKLLKNQLLADNLVGDYIEKQ